MIEKEEVIVKLKSEIVILKSQLEDLKTKFDQRTVAEKEKFMKSLQA